MIQPQEQKTNSLQKIIIVIIIISGIIWGGYVLVTNVLIPKAAVSLLEKSGAIPQIKQRFIKAGVKFDPQEIKEMNGFLERMTTKDLMAAVNSLSKSDDGLSKNQFLDEINNAVHLSDLPFVKRRGGWLNVKKSMMQGLKQKDVDQIVRYTKDNKDKIESALPIFLKVFKKTGKNILEKLTK